MHVRLVIIPIISHLNWWQQCACRMINHDEKQWQDMDGPILNSQNMYHPSPSRWVMGVCCIWPCYKKAILYHNYWFWSIRQCNIFQPRFQVAGLGCILVLLTLMSNWVKMKNFSQHQIDRNVDNTSCSYPEKGSFSTSWRGHQLQTGVATFYNK